MSNSSDWRSTDSGSGGGAPWWLWILAIIGTFVIARFALGLVWGLLPILLVALVVYGGYRMLTSDSDKSSQISSDSSHGTHSAHRTTVSSRSGTMQDASALDSLKNRMNQQNSASSDDSERMRRKEAELDEFDRRLAEIDAELGDLEDSDQR